MTAFLKAFAKTTQLNEIDADKQWSAYSQQLSDKERKQIENGGAYSGQRMAKAFCLLYPHQPKETTP